MKSSNDMEEAIKKNLNFTASAEMRERIFTDIMDAQEESKKTKSALAAPNIRSIIMKSTITKLAAAAVIVIVVGIGIYYFTGDGTTPVYGITDMPELFRTAKTVHLKGWDYFPGYKTPDGNEVPPVNDEEWHDLENGRQRSTTWTKSGRRDATTISVGERISDGQYCLRLNQTRKTAHFSKINKYQQMRAQHRSLEGVWALIFGDINKLDNSVKIGREKVDGVDCDIWECEQIFSATKGGKRYRYWISPSTGECKRIQYWMRFSDKQQWELRHEYYKIERDVDIPEGIFATEVPEGYEARNTKEMAMVLELGSPNIGGGGGLVWGVAYSFTMSDGSVIWGWNCVDKKSEKPQEESFEGLESGGPLPKLPIEFNALKLAGGPKDITYKGYHLTYTRKADRFTEWAIYVPDGMPPKNVKRLGYHALYVLNKPGLGMKINLPVPYGLLIDTKEDFDRWVLGAMAELSDDGKAPENVTYESVLRLTKQIRESLAQ